MYVITNH